MKVKDRQRLQRRRDQYALPGRSVAIRVACRWLRSKAE